MSYLTDVAQAIGKKLSNDGVGVYWRSGQAVPVGKWGMTLMDLPDTDAPTFALTPYAIEDTMTFDEDDTESVLGLQVRFQVGGLSPVATNMIRTGVDAVFDSLQQASNIDANGSSILLMYRTESASLGASDNGRWSWADTYQLFVYRA